MEGFTLKKMWKKVLQAVMVGGIAVSLTACGGGEQAATQGSSPKSDSSDQEKIVLKFSHVVSAETPKGQAIEFFKKEVESKSNGQMVVEVFPSSQLYGDADEMEALIAGNVQFIAPSSTKVVQISPSFQIFDVPFMFDSEETVEKFWNDPKGGQAMMAQLESKGLLGLGFLSSGFKQMFDGKAPLISPADMNGLKFRAAAGGILTEQFEALGASSVSLPFGEVYSALQQGTIDGSENSWSNIYTQKFFEVNPYITETNHGRFDYSMITNQEFFNSLKPEQQQIIKDAVKAAQDFSIKAVQEQDKAFKEKIKENKNVKITELTPEQRQAFREAVAKKYPDWESRIGSELFQFALSLSK